MECFENFEYSAFFELNATMMREADPMLLPGSVHCVVQWDNKGVPEEVPVLHLHGTKDKVLPYRKVKQDITIEGGPHMMIMTHPKEIAGHVNQVLAS